MSALAPTLTPTLSHGERGNFGPSPLFWLVIIIACGLLLATLTATHAVERHGAEAIQARQCAERPEHLFFNPSNGRTAMVCLTFEGVFGVYVVDELGKEVTAFVKNKMKSFDQVKQYLKNAGYGFIQ